jgi:hypothetical protein
MINSFKLKDNEKLHIYCLSDTHIGSNVFNEDYFQYALNIIENDPSEKIIYLNGDILEVGSRKVGNSAFTQKVNVNKQLDTAIEYLKPLKKNIHCCTKGNHDSLRIKKDYDFDLNQVLASAFGCESTSQFIETLNINNQPYTVYCTHGKGSAPKEPHLALGKVVRETSHVASNLSFYGHIHRADYIQKVAVINGEYKRRTFVISGHFLSYKDSYAEEMGLKPVPEAFTRVDVDKNLNTSVKVFNIDEQCPEMVNLL